MRPTRLAKAKALTEASEEWVRFEWAIQIARPATETFTNEALMLLHLAMGDRALRESQISSSTQAPVATMIKQEPCWHRTADRPPTKEDANEKGRVLWGEVSVVGIISQKIGYWDTARPYLFWLPIPPVPGVDAEKK